MMRDLANKQLSKHSVGGKFELVTAEEQRAAISIQKVSRGRAARRGVADEQQFLATKWRDADLSGGSGAALKAARKSMVNSQR